MNEILKGAKTTWVDDSPFVIPNGPTIWTIKLVQSGQEPEIYKTMSKALAVNGFLGDVEVYTNDKGKTYVRQAPKEENTPGTASFDDKQESIARQSALKSAVTFLAGGKGTTLDVLEAAELFYNWLNTDTDTATKEVLSKHGLEPEFILPPEDLDD